MNAVVSLGLATKGWLTMLGMLAVQGAVLTLAALVITRLGRLRPAWQAAVWLVVAIKLALPWGPAMPYSLSDLVALLTDHGSATPAFALTPDLVRVAAPVEAWPSVGWIALFGVWLLGALVVVVRSVLVHRRAIHAADAAIAAPAWAQAVLRELGARRTRLLVGASDVGPHVIGLVSPRIVIPPAVLDDPSLLRAVLLHELAHVRRLDAIARLIQIIASTLMWWNPFVRLVHRKLDLAREAACDADALELGGVARPAYARLLLRMASLRAPAYGASLAAPRALDARLAAVLGAPVRARMTRWHRILIAAWAVMALGGARTAAARGKPDVCVYTTQMAAALYDAFPDADRDGDGLLSRDEACDLQTELRRVPDEERMSRLPTNDPEIESLLAEPLCTFNETTTCSKFEGDE